MDAVEASVVVAVSNRVFTYKLSHTSIKMSKVQDFRHFLSTDSQQALLFIILIYIILLWGSFSVKKSVVCGLFVQRLRTASPSWTDGQFAGKANSFVDMKINVGFFCIVLAYSYLCIQKN